MYNDRAVAARLVEPVVCLFGNYTSHTSNCYIHRGSDWRSITWARCLPGRRRKRRVDAFVVLASA